MTIISIMKGILICLHLLLQYAVFSVTAQSVILSTERKFVENSNTTFLCDFTAAWNTGSVRIWTGPGSVSLISNGVSINNRYVEDISNAATTSQFSMTIINYGSGDEGDYQCQYEFPLSNTITLSTSNTEVHPAASSLDATMPLAPQAINLAISIAGIRPAATASYNFTDSAGLLKVNGNANVTSTNDPNGRTVTSSLQIDIPDPTSAGDIFTITLLVGTYTQTKQWIIQGTPTTPAPSPCRCGWDWLPCDWECYYFYIIIAAVVVVVVFLLVVGVCCCCRCSDDDAEAYVCCMRKKKSRKDSVNLNENENGQKNVPRSSENGRQVNPCESGKEDTSESPCHNNPAYFESEGTDM